MKRMLKHSFVLGTSTLVAGAIAVALILRPSGSLRRGPELAVPDRIPPAARAVLRSKMRRHAEQLPALDYDGAARIAGEIFDEPELARPITGDELNALLPERFFTLQAALRNGARQVVEAAARRDSLKLGEAFNTLTGTCVACHNVYLRGATE
jgi:hypothetical protein